jgi:hypothetical protein
MGVLLLLSMMAMPLAEAQYAPNRALRLLVRFTSGASMLRSVLEGGQLEFGPTDLKQVRICSRVVSRPCAYEAWDIKRSLGCALEIELSP